MRCPLCINETLDAHHRNGIEIDICPRCRGIWLDRGELDRLLDDDGVADPPTPPATLLDPGQSSRPPKPNRPDAYARVGEERHDDRFREDHRSERPRKRKRKKSRAARLADLIEDIID